MGEGTPLNRRGLTMTTNDLAPRDERKRLEEEISTLRGEIGVTVREIERRARESVNVRLQVRRHPLFGVAVVVLATGTIAFAIAYPISLRRRHERPSRPRNLWDALAYLTVHPEAVMGSASPSAGERLIAMGTDLLGFGAKKLLMRLLFRE